MSSAEALLTAFEHFANGSRLIPEQVWDSNDIPELKLFRGKPSGAACPLVWAHSEYVKLWRSLSEGAVFDQPPQTVERYLTQKKSANHFEWRYNNKCSSMPQGKVLRLVLLSPAKAQWSFDRRKSFEDTNTTDTGVGAYIVDLPTTELPVGARVCFTFYWTETNKWEGAHFEVTIEPKDTGTKVSSEIEHTLAHSG